MTFFSHHKRAENWWNFKVYKSIDSKKLKKIDEHQWLITRFRWLIYLSASFPIEFHIESTSQSTQISIFKNKKQHRNWASFFKKKIQKNKIKMYFKKFLIKTDWWYSQNRADNLLD